MKIKTILAVSFILIGMNARTYLYAEDPKTLDTGAAAPAFSLPGIEGKTYTLNSFSKEKILVIIFTANHCPTAQAYEERINPITGL